MTSSTAHAWHLRRTPRQAAEDLLGRAGHRLFVGAYLFGVAICPAGAGPEPVDHGDALAWLDRRQAARPS